MPDLRTWYPDETCCRINWEASADLAADVAWGNFRLPPGLVGVFASLLSNVSIAIDKSVGQLLIVRGKGVSSASVGEPTNGSLVEVQEIGNDGLHHPGYILTAGIGPRPIRHPLEGGQDYTMMVKSFGAAVARVDIALSGWAWPRNSKASLK